MPSKDLGVYLQETRGIKCLHLEFHHRNHFFNEDQLFLFDAMLYNI